MVVKPWGSGVCESLGSVCRIVCMCPRAFLGGRGESITFTRFSKGALTPALNRNVFSGQGLPPPSRKNLTDLCLISEPLNVGGKKIRSPTSCLRAQMRRGGDLQCQLKSWPRGPTTFVTLGSYLASPAWVSSCARCGPRCGRQFW